MTSNQSSYRQIMKATSLFGGVQLINIVIQVIRSKVVAVILGPAGFGILGLFNSTVALIKSTTDFGLGVSAVKDIAKANEENNALGLGKTIQIVRRLVWITGSLGAFLTIVLSPWLSKLAFGNSSFTLTFVLLSLVLLLKQLTTGELAVLQGMRRNKSLAKSNVLGSVLGLIITIPLYYVFGADAIALGIVLVALSSYIVSHFYSSRISIKKVVLSYRQILFGGEKMLKMGFIISLSSLLSMGSSYVLRIYISRTGGIEQVGLYDAGFIIINTYVGLVFTAMSSDYFPRLSAVSNNSRLSRRIINHQAEIAILILAPILVIFFIFIEEIIVLLYSHQFVEISKMIYWAALGVFFKAVTWSIGYLFLAKGNSKLFFLSELISNAYTICLNLLGYYYFGLEGLGVSFLLAYMISLIQVYLLAKAWYNFSISRSLISIFIIHFLLAFIGFLIAYHLVLKNTVLIGSVLIIISMVYSLIQIDNRIDLKQLIFKK